MDLIDLEESPSERLARVGAKGLSDIELVSLLIGSGRDDHEARRAARGLLDDLGGLSGLGAFEGQLRPESEPRSSVLLAALELARRLARTRITRRRVLDVPGAVAAYLALRYSSEDQEILGALFLDTQHRLISEHELFRGTFSRISVEPRTVLKEALLQSAKGILLFHNHPSGDLTPSNDDLVFTRRMVAAADLVGIRLVDHLILDRDGRWNSILESSIDTESAGKPQENRDFRRMDG